MLTRKQFYFMSLGTVLVGCGGGGQEPSPDAPITPRIRVNWPAVTRAFEPSVYAKSFRVTLLNASLGQTEPVIPAGENVIIAANRSDESAHKAVYVASEPIRSGFVRAQVEFFEEPDGQGRQILQVIRDVEPDRDGFLPAIPLLSGTGAPIRIGLGFPPDSTRRWFVGVTYFFNVNPTPNNLLSSPGVKAEDATWEIVSSEPEQGPVIELTTTTASGRVPGQPKFKGLRPGTATITVTIDGVKSGALTVKIEPRTI